MVNGSRTDHAHHTDPETCVKCLHHANKFRVAKRVGIIYQYIKQIPARIMI